MTAATAENCAWCGSRALRPATRFGASIARCGACGVYNTVPQPSDAELDRAYSGWYRPDTGRFGLFDRLLWKTRGSLARRIDAVAPAGPVLDVGAGDGALVAALARRGREVLGIERVADGRHIRAIELEAVDGEWAAIVFWHSLEHLRCPRKALERAAALLAPGGHMFIAMPNPASLQATTFGSRWFALDLPRHLVHVPARALQARLQSLQLDVVSVSYWRGGQVVFGWLHGLTGRVPGMPSLYDALRIRDARAEAVTIRTRVVTLGLAALLLPLALLCAGIEVVLRRGGTVYVEARRG